MTWITRIEPNLIVWSFHYGTNDQPDMQCLRNNSILLMGYMIFFPAVFKLVQAHINFGWKSLWGGDPVDMTNLPQKLPKYAPFFHPYGTSCVFAMLGCSFIRASGAGVLFSLVLATGFYAAYQLERILLQVPVGEPILPVLCKHYPFSEINALIQCCARLALKKPLEADPKAAHRNVGGPTQESGEDPSKIGYPVEEIGEEKGVEELVEEKGDEELVEEKGVKELVEEKGDEELIEEKGVEEVDEEKGVEEVDEEKSAQKFDEERAVEELVGGDEDPE